MLSDSETDSNMSRPPTPDRHKYPRHRLSGMQSKDDRALKHEASMEEQRNAAGGPLQMVREPSPFDALQNGTAAHKRMEGIDGVTDKASDIPKIAQAVASASGARSNVPPAGTSAKQGTAAARPAPTSRPSSPPPRAMSPASKSNASTMVSGNSSSGPGGFVPPPMASNPSSSSLATVKAPAGQQPSLTGAASPVKGSPPAMLPQEVAQSAKANGTTEKADKDRDGGRGILRRMLSGGGAHDRDRSSNGSGNQSPSRSPNARASSSYTQSRVPSSSHPSPPGTPKDENVGGPDGTSLMHAVQSMNLGGNGAAQGGSPGGSQPPSRNVSVKRKDGKTGAADATQDKQEGGSRLTAAALRDMESKHTPASGSKPKDKDARSTASSTLKDMFGLGGGPGKMTRRGSNVSHGNRSDKSGSEKGDAKSQAGKSAAGSENTASLLKKYGVCEKAAIGKGATAVVRLAHKWDRSTEKLYAVKEFRKRRKNETEKEYVKKLTSEFCISSTLHHINIVETVDLVQDEHKHWCEVMEYCPGGDLYAAIKRGGMSQGEVECCFRQILNGIGYLHSMGVAHRDIKPENLLLDATGHVKITDFGVSDVFRMCWEKSTHYSKGLCGSEPYIAPEQFDCKEYDARLVDVWAAAVVFYCMQFQELPWRVAKMSDPTFKEFVHSYHGSPAPSPLSNLSPRECRPLLKKMLCPDPKGRWGLEDILKDPWLSSVELCENGVAGNHKHHIVQMAITSMPSS